MRRVVTLIAFVVASLAGCGGYDYCEGKCRWARDHEGCMQRCEPPLWLQ